ncbi:hypothetical protein BBJ28_00015816 [Nothophytophthora sp. Chile5]|nr:hypothetical protein BBJ28_00015816 [Nothophytophthora sp. Chile5]
MPPKSAVATERLKKELAAQRARAAALQHLDSTGSGPSHRERAEQQRLRQQKTANATSTAAQRRVAGALPREQTATEKYDPRVRDNTLHAVALRRAQELQTTQKLTAQAETYHTGHGVSSALPDGWKEATDDTSGDTYYWNERTKETSWDRPRSAQPAGDDTKAAEAKGTSSQLTEYVDTHSFLLLMDRGVERLTHCPAF